MKFTIILLTLSSMLALSGNYSKAADIQLSALPKKEVSSLLSQDMKEAFSAMRAAKNIQDMETLLDKRLFSLLKDATIIVKGQVTNEAGIPIPYANVVVTEIRNSGSEELHHEHAPMEFKVKTDKDGYYIFKNISIYNFYKLGTFIANNVQPKPNFKISIDAKGYKAHEKEFLSINRQVLALSVEMLDVLYDFSEKKGKKLSTINKEYKIPRENTLDELQLNTVLKKE